MLLQIENLQEIIQQHAAQIAGLEKERDFYYQKLRDVEVICQEPECESLSHTQRILEILYATEVCAFIRQYINKIHSLLLSSISGWIRSARSRKWQW